MHLSMDNIEYIYIYIYKLVTVVEGKPKDYFSIATTLKCRESAKPFLGLLYFALFTYLRMMSVKIRSLKYHFLSLWYGATWDWTPIYRAIYVLYNTRVQNTLDELEQNTQCLKRRKTLNKWFWVCTFQWTIFTYIYIYKVIHRQICFVLSDSSVWLDILASRGWDRHPVGSHFKPLPLSHEETVATR